MSHPHDQESMMNTLVLVLGATTSVAVLGGVANLVWLTREACRRERNAPA
jgi:hypothetical protein